MRLHVNGKDIEKQKIYIGFEGEKNYTEIEFDFSDVFSEYPEASAYMNIKPYKGEIYPHTLTREGTNLLVWNVNEADCTVPGVGMYQITFTYNNTVIKSFKGICVVRDSIIGSADPPTPVEEWIVDASAALAALENITASAENLPEGSEATAEIRTVNGHKDIHIGVPAGEKGDQGFSPVVTVTDVPGGHQVVIEDESGEHTFTVMNGEDGDDGVSPQVTVTNITGGHRVSVTDASGTDTFDVMDGQDGQDGVTPDFSIGTVQTLSAGSDATASVTGTAENPVLNLGIPQGAKGDPGEIPQETLDQIEDDITDLKLNKADIIVSSASGAIASFPDGAESTAKELVVGIEPVQDLHGQDAPYPPGGGKNKLEVTSTSETQNGVTITVNSDGTISLSGTATDQVIFGVGSVALSGEYILSGCPSGGNYSTYFLYCINYDYGSGATVTFDGTIKNVQLYVRSGVNTNGLVFKPMIRLASVSDATFSPYSNICPISGWTGANVSRTGKNLLNKADATITSGNAIWGGTTQTFTGFLLKAGTYTLSCSHNVAGFYVGTEDGNFHVAYNRTSTTFTNPKTQEVKINFYINNVTQADMQSYDYQLEFSSTASAYEPYTAQSLSISFPSSAGTVYGGSLTVNEDGSGKLVVDRASVDLGTLTWNLTYDRFNAPLPSIKPASNQSAKPNVICSAYPTITPNEWYAKTIGVTSLITGYIGNGYVGLFDPTYPDASSLQSALSGVQLVYELDTPIEYTLTDVEVLELLKGTNNVWADTGNTSVTYRADTKLFIEKKISELVAQIVNS